MEVRELTQALKSEATRLGFCFAGACPAVQPPGFDRLRDWLQAGYAGQMHYLTNRLEAYEHPHHVLEDAKSLLVLAADYRSVAPQDPAPDRGRIARYAWGLDYHDVLWQRLNSLADFHRRLTPNANVRGVVDTAPLMEREFAVLAGLGWIGKNTLLLTREHGSWLFLAVLLTTETLAYDTPFAANHCGTCRACLDACPTGALVQPYVLDARRCISYLTIELRDMPPDELRDASGEWLFGCDICQDVCPWNQDRNLAPFTPDPVPEFAPLTEETSLDLPHLFQLDDEHFRTRFRKTPLWRAKRRGLLRNAALTLGTRCPPNAAQALSLGLNDKEPLVRAASAWALGQLATPESRTHLQQHLSTEQDPTVRQEIRNHL